MDIIDTILIVFNNHNNPAVVLIGTNFCLKVHSVNVQHKNAPF